MQNKTDEYWKQLKSWLGYQLRLGLFDEKLNEKSSLLFAIDANVAHVMIDYDKNLAIDPSNLLRKPKQWKHEFESYKKIKSAFAGQNALITQHLLNHPHLFFFSGFKEETQGKKWTYTRNDSLNLNKAEKEIKEFLLLKTEPTSKEFKSLLQKKLTVRPTILKQMARKLTPLSGTKINNIILERGTSLKEYFEFYEMSNKLKRELELQKANQSDDSKIDHTTQIDAEALAELLTYNKILAKNNINARIVFYTTDIHIFSVMSEYDHFHSELFEDKNALSAADAYIRHPFSLLKSFFIEESVSPKNEDEPNEEETKIKQALASLIELWVGKELNEVSTYQDIFNSKTISTTEEGNKNTRQDILNEWAILWKKIKDTSVFEMLPKDDLEDETIEKLVRDYLIDPAADFANAIAPEEIQQLAKVNPQTDIGVIRELPPIYFSNPNARKTYQALLSAQRDVNKIEDLVSNWKREKISSYYSYFVLLASANCAKPKTWHRAESYARFSAWLCPRLEEIKDSESDDTSIRFDGQEAYFLLAFIRRFLIALDDQTPDIFKKRYQEGIMLLEESCKRSIKTKSEREQFKLPHTVGFDASVASLIIEFSPNLKFYWLYMMYATVGIFRSVYVSGDKQEVRECLYKLNEMIKINHGLLSCANEPMRNFKELCEKRNDDPEPYELEMVIAQLWANSIICCASLYQQKHRSSDKGNIEKEISSYLPPVSLARKKSERSTYHDHIETLAKALAYLLKIENWQLPTSSELNLAKTWFEKKENMIFCYDEKRFKDYAKIIEKALKKTSQESE